MAAVWFLCPHEIHFSLGGCALPHALVHRAPLKDDHAPGQRLQVTSEKRPVTALCRTMTPAPWVAGCSWVGVYDHPPLVRGGRNLAVVRVGGGGELHLQDEIQHGISCRLGSEAHQPSSPFCIPPPISSHPTTAQPPEYPQPLPAWLRTYVHQGDRIRPCRGVHLFWAVPFRRSNCPFASTFFLQHP